MLKIDKNNLAPICLFTYNRPWHTEQVLKSLQKNDLASESELYIFLDGPRKNANQNDLDKIKEVQRIINGKKWCKKVNIVEEKKNKGLATSIIDGVSGVVNRYGKVIVLEDDLVLSRGFLRYMNDALVVYCDENKVMHISAYMFPVKNKMPETFFVNIATCWGWATWRRSWRYLNPDPNKLLEKIKQTGEIKKFNLDGSYDWYSHLLANVDGEMNTWAIKWYASFFLQNGFCLHPRLSLVRNIGNDGSGENCSIASEYCKQLIVDKIKVEKIPIVESREARNTLRKFFKKRHKLSLFSMLKNKIKTYAYKRMAKKRI